MRRLDVTMCFLGMLALLSVAMPLSVLRAQARFDHIGLEQGLPYSRVICLLQDRQGYMWVGTRAGLGRWDSYNMTVFRSNPEDSTSLSNSNIWALYEDHRGTIWVGTEGGGLNRFDAGTDRFLLTSAGAAMIRVYGCWALRLRVLGEGVEHMTRVLLR